MNDLLLDLARKYDIEVLFACEAGSRAWGIETDHSDFDIRFIYRYKDIKKYLSLQKTQDVIELRTPYDVTGFDVLKTGSLILKSNPSIYEWAYTSIIYKELNSFSFHLKNMIETNYSPFSLFMHYSSLKKRNTKEVCKGNYNNKKQKQLIQAIRAELICSGLINIKTVHSPFAYIQGAKEFSPKMFEAYQKVTEAKQKQILLSKTEVMNITELLLLVEKSEEWNLLPRIKPSIQMIDNWLWRLLELKK